MTTPAPETIKFLRGLTADQLRAVLHYDPDTGIFTRLIPHAGLKQGDRAGGLRTDGYVVIRVRGEMFKAHRLAWLYMTGEWPDGYIDHINMVRADNRWSNLRLATWAQNQQNTARRSDNRSGFKGVGWHKDAGKWCARIKLGGRTKHIGLFATPEEAHAAYCRAAEERGEFGRTG
jgi:hypothetical protein